MAYIIKGSFSASLFPDIMEAVGNAQVRIYRVLDDGGSKIRSSQNKKDLHVLTAKEIQKKDDHLVAKGNTDEDGTYEIELPDIYQGDPIAIDLKIITLPGRKKVKNKPVQFSVLSVHPLWRSNNDGLHYCFNYCIPSEFWCEIRTIFDVWTISGHVKTAESDQTPVQDVTVTAFDSDWIKDDILGNSITDKNGYFRIDFKQTFLSPLINIETPISSIPGPGIYFKVTAPGGTILYEEEWGKGQTEERKHIPRCYTVDLCVTGINSNTIERD